MQSNHYTILCHFTTYHTHMLRDFHLPGIQFKEYHPENPLSADFFLTDSDRGIQLGQELTVPVIAFRHELNTSESLMAASWMILSIDALCPEYLEEISARFYKKPLLIGKTSQLVIRELAMEDLPALIDLQMALKAHPDGHFFPEDCADPENYLYNYIANQYPFFGFGIYGLYLQKDNSLIGIAGFSETLSSDTANISYAIHPDHQRKGFASEALLTLYSMAEDRFGFENVLAYIQKNNTASVRLAQKCGIPYQLI